MSDNFKRKVRYRSAFELASVLLRRRKPSPDPSPGTNDPRTTDLERIVLQVAGALSASPDDPDVREAVGDVIDGKTRRW